MTEEEPQPPHNPYAGSQQQPNWGSAYPPQGQQPHGSPSSDTPPGAQATPPPGSPPPGYPQPGVPPQGGYYPPQGGYYPPPGYGYPVAPVQPKHESATTSMVLGLVSLIGMFTCLLPIAIAPFAWYTGAKAVREIDASQGRLGGRSEATAGKVMGIIGTVILALGVIAIIALIVLSITVDNFWDDESGYDGGSSYDTMVRVI